MVNLLVFAKKKNVNRPYLLLHYFIIMIGVLLKITTDWSTTINTEFVTLGLYFSLIIILIIPVVLNLGVYSLAKPLAINLILICIEVALFFCFLTKNLLFFYIAFETILIPMYLLVGIEGLGLRKIKAAYLLFLYTLFGSLFILFGMFYLYIIVNSFDYNTLQLTTFSYFQQTLLCFCFLIAFAVKIPCVPFHLWLPEAHVEASTVGSIILASLILKLPGYGLITFTVHWFPYGCIFYENMIQTIACLSIIYSSLAAFVQLDLKKIIAYTSIAHMNLVILGIFSTNDLGTYGAIYLMIGHAVVSSALFFCIGILYSRYHTKNIYYFGGLVPIMPVFCIFFFFFSIANLSFPGTCNFIGELLIFSDLVFTNTFILIISSLTIIFSAIYSIWMYNRLCYGAIKTKYILMYRDITFKELGILLLFLSLTILLGLNSNFVFKPAVLY